MCTYVNIPDIIFQMKHSLHEHSLFLCYLVQNILNTLQNQVERLNKAKMRYNTNVLKKRKGATDF